MRERRKGEEKDFPPPASSRDGSNFRREETRGERRGKMSREREEDSERERHKKERESFPPASPRDGISVARERVMEERKTGEKKGGEEFNFPSFARHTRARAREEAGQKAEKGTEVFGDGRRNERRGRKSLREKERMGRKGV